MARILSIFLILIFWTPTIWAQDDSFSEGNNFYKEGKYQEAITSYEKLLKDNEHAATLYYNLGNAYFKKGALANAILNYERALRIQPSDKDIHTNLKFANMQIADKIQAPKRYFIGKWVNNITEKLHSNVWAYWGIAFWAILFLMLILFSRTHSESKRKALFTLSLVSFCIASFFFYASYSQYTKNESSPYAIVFAQNITAKSTPSNNGTDLFILHEGTKVKILDKVGTWNKIQLADEREGWLPAKKIKKI